MNRDNSRLSADVFPSFSEERSRRRRQGPPQEQYGPGVVWGVPVEGLESRLLFAVTVSHNTTTNTLTITGDNNANDIRIYQQDYVGTDQISVDVVGEGYTDPTT